MRDEQLKLAKERLDKRELTPITEENKNEYYKHYESIWYDEPHTSKLQEILKTER